MSYFAEYDRYCDPDFYDCASTPEPLETHTDDDLGWPSGAVEAVDSRASPEFDEPLPELSF
jgi:hypothetical protein